MLILRQDGEVELVLSDQVDLPGLFVELAWATIWCTERMSRDGDPAWSMRVQLETCSGRFSLLELICDPIDYVSPLD